MASTLVTRVGDWSKEVAIIIEDDGEIRLQLPLGDSEVVLTRADARLIAADLRRAAGPA